MIQSLQNKNKLNWDKFKKKTQKRNRAIYKKYLKGKKTQEELGADHGLTKSRVSYIIKTEIKNLNKVNTIDKR